MVVDNDDDDDDDDDDVDNDDVAGVTTVGNGGGGVVGDVGTGCTTGLPIAGICNAVKSPFSDNGKGNAGVEPIGGVC